MAERK